MTEDHHTHTEADAGAYERARFLPADDRPTKDEVDDDAADPWQREIPYVPHTHTWLPPIQLCATCGAAKEVEA